MKGASKGLNGALMKENLIKFSENSDRRGRFYSLITGNTEGNEFSKENSFGLKSTLMKEKSKESTTRKSAENVFSRELKPVATNNLSQYLKSNQNLPKKKKKTTISLVNENSNDKNKENIPDITNRLTSSGGSTKKTCFSSVFNPKVLETNDLKLSLTNEINVEYLKEERKSLRKKVENEVEIPPLESIKAKMNHLALNCREKALLSELIEREEILKDLQLSQRMKYCTISKKPILLTNNECSTFIQKSLELEKFKEKFQEYENLLFDLINKGKELKDKLDVC